MPDTSALEAELDAVRDATLRSPPDALPPAMYHYTPATGFRGILESGCIWATDARFTNDTNELKHADEAIKAAASAVSVQATGLGRTVLSIFAEDHEPVVHPGVEVFVACFSGQPDLLPQWVSYADGGKGYAIGIKTTYGGKNHPYPCGEWDVGAVDLFRVRYDAGALRMNFAKFLEGCLGIVAQHQGSNDEMLLSVVLRHIRVAASQEGLRLKDASSNHEQEWRLVVLADPGSSECRFRIVNGVIVPYVTLRLAPESKPLPIHRVYVGPAHRAGGTLDVATTGARALLAGKILGTSRASLSRAS